MSTFLHFSEIHPLTAPGFYSVLCGEAAMLPDETNFIKAKLSVVVDGKTGAVGSTWPVDNQPNTNPHFQFASKSGRQCLIVDLDCAIDPQEGHPLFHIDHITCERGEFVERIYHVTSPALGDPRHPLTACAPGTKSIGIEFNMPATGKTAPFKFSVYVRKHGTTEIHDADPQVGNDPP